MRDRLRADLKSAIKSRDLETVNALRTTLAAIDNAEAIDGRTGGAPTSESEHVAGAVAGAHSADLPRRLLSAAEVAAIVRQQAEERQQAAGDYERLGRAEDARRSLREADLLRSYLT